MLEKIAKHVGLGKVKDSIRKVKIYQETSANLQDVWLSPTTQLSQQQGGPTFNFIFEKYQNGQSGRPKILSKDPPTLSDLKESAARIEAALSTASAELDVDGLDDEIFDEGDETKANAAATMSKMLDGFSDGAFQEKQGKKRRGAGGASAVSTKAPAPTDDAELASAASSKRKLAGQDVSELDPEMRKVAVAHTQDKPNTSIRSLQMLRVHLFYSPNPDHKKGHALPAAAWIQIL